MAITTGTRYVLAGFLSLCVAGVVVAAGEPLSLSVDIHLNVLNKSYGRMYI